MEITTVINIVLACALSFIGGMVAMYYLLTGEEGEHHVH